VYTRGAGVRGPEPYGCYNSGFAPVIRRSKLTGRYIVGFQLDTEFAVKDIRSLGKRTFKVNGRPVWSFKTRKPAVAKFQELVIARNAENQAIADEYRLNLAAAKAGDLEALSKLGDI
jgi:hypothetical protein